MDLSSQLNYATVIITANLNFVENEIVLSMERISIIICVHEHAGIVHTSPPTRMNDPEFRGRLDRWVDKYPGIIKADSPLGKLAIKLVQVRSPLIFEVMKGIWITAEFALQLLSAYNRTYDDSHASHVILPYVIDWWNIKGDNGFLSYERCYYGDNTHKLPTQVPPLRSEMNRRHSINPPRYLMQQMHLI